MQIMIHIAVLNECAKILAKWQTAKRATTVNDMLVKRKRTTEVPLIFRNDRSSSIYLTNRIEPNPALSFGKLIY